MAARYGIDILLRLAEEEDSDIYIALASNPQIPDELLNKLKGLDVGFWSECDFEEALFSNKKIHLNTLIENKSHSYFCLRIGIARNPNATPELLSQLAKDESGFVREAVAKNPNTPTDVLTYIVNHEEDGWLPTARDYAFSNPNIPVQLLEYYAKLDDLDIRKNIAANHIAPASILSERFSLKSTVINERIARNPATPMKLLNTLAQDDSMFFNLRDEVASNPNYPVNSLISLL